MEEFNESFLDDNISEIETLLGGNKEVEDTIGGVKYSIFENLNDLDDFDSFDTCKFGDKEKNYVKYCYSEDIGKYPILSMEEIDELFKKYKKLGKRSPEGLKIRDKIINSNLRYSYKIAKHIYLGFKEHYKLNELDLNDFIQAGNIGLVYAVDNYSFSDGKKFLSYATYCISGIIYDYLKRKSRFFGSENLGSIKQIRLFADKFYDENLREPTNVEVSDFLDEYNTEHGTNFSMDLWYYYKYYLTYGVISLDQSVEDSKNLQLENATSGGSEVFSIDEEDDGLYEDNYELTLKDIILGSSDDIDYEKQDIIECVKYELNKILKYFPPKQVDILIHYFGLDGNKPMFLDELGEKCGLKRERVRQIKEMLLNKIRHSGKAKVLKEYLRELNNY